MSNDPVPAVSAGIEESNGRKKDDKNDGGGKPLWRGRDALFGPFGRGRQFFGAGKIVLAEEGFFIKAQVTRNASHKAVAEDAAG